MDREFKLRQIRQGQSHSGKEQFPNEICSFNCQKICKKWPFTRTLSSLLLIPFYAAFSRSMIKIGYEDIFHFSFSCRVQILEDGQVLQINYVTPSEQLHISFFFKKN